MMLVNGLTYKIQRKPRQEWNQEKVLFIGNNGVSVMESPKTGESEGFLVSFPVGTRSGRAMRGACNFSQETARATCIQLIETARHADEFWPHCDGIFRG